FHADLSQPDNNLTEDERQQLSLLGTLAAGLAGGLAGNSTAAATTGAQAGKNAVENNSLAHVLAAAEKVKPGTIEKHQQEVKAACEESPEMCRKAVNTALGLAEDFTPGYGDYKSFKEAETTLDYLIATVGLAPGLGYGVSKLLKAAQTTDAINKIESALKGHGI
ncbi:MAG: VENN motif pre-toxin domain-containing protein, partial [Mixta sp.]